jgi:hypothetical protein
MKGIFAPLVLTTALLSPAFAQNGHGLHFAPAPLIGAGLPGLVVGIGYGVYWLVRRRR